MEFERNCNIVESFIPSSSSKNIFKDLASQNSLSTLEELISSRNFALMFGNSINIPKIPKAETSVLTKLLVKDTVSYGDKSFTSCSISSLCSSSSPYDNHNNLTFFTSGKSQEIDQNISLADIEFGKLNLDNINQYLQKIDALEIKLAKRSLNYKNDFGYGVDFSSEPPLDCDSGEVRNLSQIFRQTKQRNISIASERTDSSIVSTRRNSSSRGAAAIYKRKRRISLQSDDSCVDSTDSNSTDSEIDQNDLCSRFCPLLEVPKITLEKEQELEIFLLSFGPTKFLDSSDPTGITEVDPTTLSMDKLQPIIKTQEHQLQALKQRYKELMTGFFNVKKEIFKLKKRRRWERENNNQKEFQGSTAYVPTLPAIEESCNSPKTAHVNTYDIAKDMLFASSDMTSSSSFLISGNFSVLNKKKVATHSNNV